MMSERIGILGGTFDPVHLGHLYLAEKVLRKLNLDKIIFIPAYIPPHKDIKVTKPAHRFNMVNLAISYNKRFEVSDIELKRKGKSYSVETLRLLRKRYGDKVEIFFIAGSDALGELDKWREFDEILKLCTFVVVLRPQFAAKFMPENFILLRIRARRISSTDIRRRLKRGRSISKLVPPGVEEYIRTHGLYRTR